MQYHIIIAMTIWFTAYVDSRKIRGISLAYRRFYKEKTSFLCIDGSKLIPFDQVNDDYCDCPDGSDEPGTAACSNGRFYCTNLGFRPHYIPSSRVNDGICDCCDASDEYNSQTHCPSTCRKLGQRQRAEVENQIRSVNEGLHLKQQLIKDGINMWHEKQNQLNDLRRVSENLHRKLEEEKKAKLEAEAHKDDVMGYQKLDGYGSKRQKFEDDAPQNIFQQLDSNKDGWVAAVEVQAQVELFQDDRHQLTETEAVDLLGGSNQVDFASFQETLFSRMKSNDKIKIKDRPSKLDNDPLVQAAIRAAEKANADLKKVEDAYETVKMEIRDLEEMLSTDYGSNKEFIYLQNQCFEMTVYEYTYMFCPFNQVTQKGSTGTETIVLGKWHSWAGPIGNKYSKMKFDKGQPCWQGPARSATVTLMCGTETVLKSVKEPSKCQYFMEFQTPAACQPLQPKRNVHNEL
ncbi:glucosidase 2 subunit beta-like [Lepisosteus oculatus]|uniref:glucosidase 2 subunit beta-like n=1 Tax=Lepisosteus oculatus TaxID=7918 RepID=UPI0035F508C9